LNGEEGLAKTQKNSDGTVAVYINLMPGASLLIKLMNNFTEAPLWVYPQTSEKFYEIKGDWEIEFINGGPVQPEKLTVSKLSSWTDFADPELKRFFGTAKYKIKFINPDPDIKNWVLDLGKVCESARVKINGKEAARLWSVPFSVLIKDLMADGENEIEIEVTNLAANRIRDLDIRGVNWKKFYDINFVNIHYKKFDASGWDLVDSGLIGPVRFYPASVVK
jgi:hypothetical protein